MGKVIVYATFAVAAALCSTSPQLDRLSTKDFASAETCKRCHAEIYQQWRSSFHSQSATDPVFWQLFRQAVRDTGSRASAICLTCHAPVATVGREVQWFGSISTPLQLTPLSREGVTCDFCHTISGAENLGKTVTVGAYRVPRKGQTEVKYGSHPDAHTPAHATQASAFLRSSQFCAICHQYTHPLPGLELQNTYYEWFYGPYRAQGRRCQDCHMPLYSGKSANHAPERDDLNAHVFAGGHTEMLRKAAIVSLWGRVSGDSRSKEIRIDALVTNAGSGHLMPTGIPGIRQLWLELKVITEGGAEVFSDRRDFGATLLDRDGNPTMPWYAVRVGTDTRLAPQRSRRERFRFKAPNPEFGRLEVRADLYYRLVSEQAAKKVGTEPSPPINVASDLLLISSEGWTKKVPVH